MGSLLAVMTQLNARRSLNYNQLLKARALAEAGVAQALWVIKTTTATIREVNGELEGVGRYQAIMQPDEGALMIRAVGKTNGLPPWENRVTAKVTFSFPEAFETALYSQEPVTLSHTHIDGRVIIKGESFSRPPIARDPLELTRESDTPAPPFPSFNHAIYNRAIRGWDRDLKVAQGATSAMSSRTEWREAGLIRWGKDRRLAMQGDLVVRFSDPSAVLEGPGTILVTGSMEIHGDSHLKDVTLIVQRALTLFDDVQVDSATCYAATIQLKDHARCSGALFAQKLIQCDGVARIRSASLLFLGNGEPRDQKQIRIEGNAQVEGTIVSHLGIRMLRETAQGGLSLSSTGDPRLISIGRDAVVQGLIFTDGPVELQGTVLGSVVAQRFREGRVEDATINRYRMPANVRIPQGFRINRRRPRLLVWSRNS